MSSALAESGTKWPVDIGTEILVPLLKVTPLKTHFGPVTRTTLASDGMYSHVASKPSGTNTALYSGLLSPDVFVTLEE